METLISHLGSTESSSSCSARMKSPLGFAVSLWNSRQETDKPSRSELHCLSINPISESFSVFLNSCSQIVYIQVFTQLAQRIIHGVLYLK